MPDDDRALAELMMAPIAAMLGEQAALESCQQYAAAALMPLLVQVEVQQHAGCDSHLLTCPCNCVAVAMQDAGPIASSACEHHSDVSFPWVLS